MGILEDFSKRFDRRKKVASPLRSYESQEELIGDLKGKKYVLMTAQNPRRTPEKGPFEEPIGDDKPDPTDPRNVQALRQMMKELDQRGLEYATHTGSWKGAPERSLIVWAPSNMDDDQFFLEMYDLMQEYGQEAMMAATPDVKTVQSQTGVTEEKMQFDGTDQYETKTPEGTLLLAFDTRDWDKLSSPQQKIVV
jgi:hypothetical protein